MALLHAACALGDLAAVRRLIQDGADVDGSRDGAVRPIVAAALGGHEEVLAHLLAHGCDPEVSDAGGHTAAGIAKHRGDQRILRLLYAFRSARLAGEIALERSNLEEEQRLLREVEAEFDAEEHALDGDEDDVDDYDGGDVEENQEEATEANSRDANSVAQDDISPPSPKCVEVQLSCLFDRLQQLHVRFPSVSGSQAPSSADLLKVCEEDELDDLRRLIEGGLSEISAEQRERRRRREEQPAGTCQICVDNPTNSAFAPCGHVVCCFSCASACDRCPICRGTISQVIRTFFS
eukprot:COSAG02_NODE_1268_length_13537_cov_14.243637_8_plen_293_part_00